MEICRNTRFCDLCKAECMPIDFSFFLFFFLRRCPFDTLWQQNWKMQLVLFCSELIWFSQRRNNSWIPLGMDSYHASCDVSTSYLGLKTIDISDVSDINIPRKIFSFLTLKFQRDKNYQVTGFAIKNITFLR